MILNSNKHKLELSSWLSSNQIEEFSRNLKLQKFIFFYEAFSKLENEIADFNYLRAYPNGPVYSDVYGDYIYQSSDFIATISNLSSYETVNEERAKLAGFLVKVLTEDELSDLTHEFDAWKVKEDMLAMGLKNISITEDDFSDADLELLSTLQMMYPQELIDSVEVISIGRKSFLISKEDKGKLTDEQENIFINLADNTGLHNPVFVSLSDDGVLLID